MPISRYYKGHGDEVMSSMRKTYGDSEQAKRVFYATAAKRDEKPKKSKKRGSK